MHLPQTVLHSPVVHQYHVHMQHMVLINSLNWHSGTPITAALLLLWRADILLAMLDWLRRRRLAASLRSPGTCVLQICQCWLSQLEQLLGTGCQAVQDTL